jgi:predicted dehydrogenase
MNQKKFPITRRTFLRNGAVLTAGIAALSPAARAQTNQNSKLRIFQIGVGGIGGLQRGQLKGYEKSEFVGFCDVDKEELDPMATQYPNAWREVDYREAFAKRGDQFDAVICDVPDFHHCTVMLTAMKYNKHLYGQKPLVHQLDEMRMMKDALRARPNLQTQMGNQRACIPGRMQAVEILKSNRLGRPVEAYVWTGGISKGHYFPDPWSPLPQGGKAPDYVNWDLWHGPLKTQIGYSDEMHPRRWRGYWETGGGQLADWGCHLLDVLYFAYDLPSPEGVMTHTPKASNTGHSAHNMSTLTYPGGKGFAREKFVVRYNDDGLNPSFMALGLPPMKVGANHTMVVCEEGVLLLQSEGKITIWRKGKDVTKDEEMPKVEPHHHWRDWVDNCLGAKKHLWTPFTIGVRITEPALLAVKATRYPGTELAWDAANYKFTNHDKANAEILKREYREGFAPPVVSVS